MYNKYKPRKFTKNEDINVIAVYWQHIDYSSVHIDADATIYYQVYNVDVAIPGSQQQEILDRATKDGKQYLSDESFIAEWALIVTWHKVKLVGSTGVSMNTCVMWEMYIQIVLRKSWMWYSVYFNMYLFIGLKYFICLQILPKMYSVLS